MLSDSIYNLLINIVGDPTNDFQGIALYVVACFVFILIIKLLYDLLSYLTGLNRR